MLTHDSAETEGGGLDIPLLTASSRLDVSTLNPEEPLIIDRPNRLPKAAYATSGPAVHQSSPTIPLD